jgi:hypothetical protein
VGIPPGIVHPGSAEAFGGQSPQGLPQAETADIVEETHDTDFVQSGQQRLNTRAYS